MLTFGVGRVAKETKTSVRPKSFFHLWMFAYLVLLGFLMSVTTAMALVLLLDEKGQLRVNFIPSSFVSITAAVAGVSVLNFSFGNLSLASAKPNWTWAQISKT